MADGDNRGTITVAGIPRHSAKRGFWSAQSYSLYFFDLYINLLFVLEESGHLQHCPVRTSYALKVRSRERPGFRVVTSEPRRPLVLGL